MSSSDSDHVDTTARALEAALARIGEPITEAQAKIAALEDCECKEGMFALATSRRALLSVAGAMAATGAAAVLPRPANAKAPPGAVEYPVPADSTKEPGRMTGVDGGYGSPAPVDDPRRLGPPPPNPPVPPRADRLTATAAPVPA